MGTPAESNCQINTETVTLPRRQRVLEMLHPNMTSDSCSTKYDNVQCAAEVAYACTNSSSGSEPIATEHASGNCALNTLPNAYYELVSNIVGYSESTHAEYAKCTSTTDV